MTADEIHDENVKAFAEALGECADAIEIDRWHPPLLIQNMSDDDCVFQLEQRGWGVVARVESSSDFEYFPHMLAASAELLDVMEDCKGVLQSFEDQLKGKCVALTIVLEKACAVIAKAKGRAAT